jgi:hypothetical protein
MKSLEDQRLSKGHLSGTIVGSKQGGVDSRFATLNPIKSLLYLLPSYTVTQRHVTSAPEVDDGDIRDNGEDIRNIVNLNIETQARSLSRTACQTSK